MRLKELIKETASSGSTTSANMGTALAGGTPPKGMFFGGDPNSSIYTTIKKHRNARKKAVSENMEPKTYKVVWQAQDNVGKGNFVHSEMFQCANRQEMDLDVEQVLDKWLMENYELEELYDVTLNYRVYLDNKRIFEGRYNYTDRHEND